MYQAALSSGVRSTIQAAKKVWDRHIDQCVEERNLFHERIRECINKDKPPAMLIYLDGMDQKKTDLPRFAGKDQDSEIFKCRYAALLY